MLREHLSGTFGSVRPISRFLFPVSIMTLTANRDAFFVGIDKYRYSEPGMTEWYIAVDPTEHPLSIPKNEEGKYAEDLMLISDEIHALLTNTPGVTRLCWFFPGWDVKKPGVLTPAELPWDVDVPGIARR